MTTASYSFDGFSYATGGKSVSDLAISQATDRDCALFRALKDDPICRDYTLQQRRDMAVARVEADRYDTRANRVNEPNLYAPQKAPSPLLVAQADEAQRKLDEAVANAKSPAESGSRTLEAVSGKSRRVGNSVANGALTPAGEMIASTTPPLSPETRTYLVLGSYASRANAETALGRYAGEFTTIASTRVGGKALHRVISGPYTPNELDRARKHLAQSYGIRDTWLLRGCTLGSDATCAAIFDRKPRPAANAVQVAAFQALQ